MIETLRTYQSETLTASVLPVTVEPGGYVVSVAYRSPRGSRPEAPLERFDTFHEAVVFAGLAVQGCWNRPVNL